MRAINIAKPNRSVGGTYGKRRKLIIRDQLSDFQQLLRIKGFDGALEIAFNPARSLPLTAASAAARQGRARLLLLPAGERRFIDANFAADFSADPALGLMQRKHDLRFGKLVGLVSEGVEI